MVTWEPVGGGSGHMKRGQWLPEWRVQWSHENQLENMLLN